MPLIESVQWDSKAKSFFTRERLHRKAERYPRKRLVKCILGLPGSLDFEQRRKSIFLPRKSIDDHGSHSCPEPPFCPLLTNIFHCHGNAVWLSAARTPGAISTHRSLTNLLIVFTSLRSVAANDGHSRLNTENHSGVIGIGFHRKQDALSVLLTKPTGLKKWNLCPAVLAHYGARPQISYRRFDDPPGFTLILKILSAKFGIEQIKVKQPAVSRRDKAGFPSFPADSICVKGLEIGIHGEKMSQVLLCLT